MVKVKFSRGKAAAHRVALLFAVLLLCPPSNMASPMVLQGNLVHSDSLKDNQQQLGKPAKPSEGQTTADEWFPVPNWLAGTWTPITTMCTEREDLWNGDIEKRATKQEVKFGESLGYQKDRIGTIWNTKFVPELLKLSERNPSTEPNDSSETKRWSVRRQIQPISETQDRVTYKITDFLSRTDSANKVIDLESRESFVTYVDLKESQLARLSDTMRYDADGQAVERIHSTSLMQKTKSFAPRNECNTRNLKTAFCKFLESSGQANLIPQADHDNRPENEPK